MAKYLEKTRELMKQFNSCEVVYVRRSQNKKAGALSKLASVGFNHLAKEVRVQELQAPSIQEQEVNCIRFIPATWMEELKAFRIDGVLPDDKAKARKVQTRALYYEIHNGILYRKSFLGPLLRCVTPDEALYLVNEIHLGICGIHAGPRMVVAKILNVGFYWPGMHGDAVHELQKCKAC
jgi:hypothetical protein